MKLVPEMRINSSYRVATIEKEIDMFLIFYFHLKGESHGHNAIFKGLKMTFRTKVLKKKLYNVNQHQKYYKLFGQLFSTTTFFDRALDRGQVQF